jgi:GPI-anchor transamidase subunit T
MGIHATWHDGETKSHHSSAEDEIDPASLGLSSKARTGKYEEDKYKKEATKKPKRSPMKPTKEERGIKLKLTVGAVRDPIEGLSREIAAEGDWSLETLFGKNVTKLCPVTSKADVRILSPPNTDSVRAKKGDGVTNSLNLRVAPLPVAMYRSQTYAMDGEKEWDVVRVGNRGLNLTVSQKDRVRNSGASPCCFFIKPLLTRVLAEVESTSPVTPLTLTRSLRGSDQTRGGLSVAITNHIDVVVDAWYVESVPWIIRPYLSTLRVESVEYLPTAAGSPGQAAQQAFSSSSNDSSVLNLHNIHYVPPSASKGQDSRTKPTLLEIPLHLPPRSTIHITVEFEKVFLKYTEHPPDAQRGWEIPGGVLVPVPFAEMNTGANGVAGRLPRMYTAPLLADLATPDFSMPYNVIILSGALVALLFGMLFNMLTRRFVLVKS